MDDDEHERNQQPAPRSLAAERRRRLDALQAAMWARHAELTDQTWTCLIQSLEVYERACELLSDVAEVKARIHASQRAAAQDIVGQHARR